VTVTVKVCVPPPEKVKLDDDIEQTAFTGAPLQANETVPLKFGPAASASL